MQNGTIKQDKLHLGMRKQEDYKMMFTTKRFLALLLAALMLLSLAACGGSGNAEDGETAAIADDGTEYHGELPFVKEGDEPITITIGVRVNGNVTDYKDNKYTKWLEEKTGLNLEFQQFTGTDTEAATQVSLMIASGEKLPDILHTGGISKLTADGYGLDGYLIDLNPYYEKYCYYQKQAFDLTNMNPPIKYLTPSGVVEPVGHE